MERTGGATNYRGLLAKLPAGQNILEHAYTAVENLINRVKDYVGVSDENTEELIRENGFEKMVFGSRNGYAIKRCGIYKRKRYTNV